jgi:site-specific DNA recombinase
MKTAAIYARVSTSDQVKGTSLDSQAQLCRDYAKEHGYTVVKVVQEDASGARLDRPKLGELRDMAQRHEIESLIVFDPDRLSRSMAHTLLLCEEFERNKAPIEFVNAPKENTPEGSMLFNLKALFAEYERSKIAERTRRGKECRVREGKVMTNKLPYGYTIIQGEGKLEIIEQEATWVRAMYGWLTNEHCSLGEIKRRLEAAHVPTKHGSISWPRSTIHRILSSPIYTGRWYYGKSAAVACAKPIFERNRGKRWSKERKDKSTWISVQVPAIISEDIYQAGIAQLALNKDKSPRNARHQYLLSGIFTCSYCGYKMHASTKYSGPGGAATGTARSVYECAGRRMLQTHLPLAERCQGRSYGGARLEQLVWEEVIRQFSDKERIMKVLREHLATKEEEQAKDEGELAVLYDIELTAKRDSAKLLDFAMADLIDRETLQERMGIIRKKLESISADKAEIVKRMEARESSQGSVEDIEALCARIQEGLPLVSYEDKRAFLDAARVRVSAAGDLITITGRITTAVLNIGRLPVRVDGVLCLPYRDRGEVEYTGQHGDTWRR